MDLAVFVKCALHRGGLNFGLGASARRFSLRYAGYAGKEPCSCGVPELFVPHSFSATPLDLDRHRSYWWHKDQRWRYPPAWLNAFSRHCNATTTKFKLAYAKKPDQQTHHYFTWHCPECDALVSSLGSSPGSVEVKDTEVATLPAPTPRSPESKFANRWWINPEVVAL
jgi:hypothetical protein